MTAHKHFKALVRSRMQKTGECYATARRQILRKAESKAQDPRTRWHFPGSIPAATALRVLLADAGMRAPHTKKPFTEAMVFGIAGGIGAGVFSFLYEKEDFASFYVAGRHSWQDDVAYFKNACARIGIKPSVRESSGAKAAEKHLRDALADGPCTAWLDMCFLPHRGIGPSWGGGAYHVCTVYKIDDSAATALLGDLADDPVTIGLDDLAAARARNKKDKHRLLSIPKCDSSPDLKKLVRTGLAACHEALTKQRMANFRLDAFRVWAERLHGSRDKESWERIFTPGHRLWRGLVSVCDYIEHYGTGGGLCRPIFADFLAEAGEALGDSRLAGLSRKYEELGRLWTELAQAALPDDVPLLKEARDLHAHKAELVMSGGVGAAAEVAAAAAKIDELNKRAREHFPLSASECDDLRAGLQTRLSRIYEAEVEALAEMKSAAG